MRRTLRRLAERVARKGKQIYDDGADYLHATGRFFGSATLAGVASSVATWVAQKFSVPGILAWLKAASLAITKFCLLNPGLAALAGVILAFVIFGGHSQV